MPGFETEMHSGFSHHVAEVGALNLRDGVVGQLMQGFGARI